MRRTPRFPNTARRALAGCCLLALTLVAMTVPARAFQPTGQWTPPMMIMETHGEVAESALVSDGRGNLHLFFPHRPAEGGPVSIDHTWWDGVEWAQPVDIIIETNAAYPHAVLDPHGTVHLIWLGTMQQLRYSSASIAEAGSARAWTAPQTVGNAVGESGIAVAEDGTLFVTYSDHQSRNAVLLVQSSDGGKTWSSPTLVARASQASVVPGGIQVAVDGVGRAHVTWTEYELPDAWPSVGTFYASSPDGGTTWSLPRQIAEGHYGQIGVGTRGRDEVHVVWRSGIGGDGTFHQWSPDGGVTWPPPHRYDDRGGFSGLPSFVEDAAGHLHYVLGAVKYAHWDGRQLSPYQDVAADRREVQTRSVERGVIGITSGNQLHIVFEFDFESLWHTSMLLDIPPVPTAAPDPELRTPTPTQTVPAVTATPAGSENENGSQTWPVGTQGPTDSFFTDPLLLGIVPILLLLMAVAVMQVSSDRVRR